MKNGRREETYEESRKKLKYGKSKSVFFYWSSVDGIVMLTLQHPLHQVGLIAGLVINFMLTVLTVYGLQIYNYVADRLEDQRGDNKRVTSIQGKLFSKTEVDLSRFM